MAQDRGWKCDCLMGLVRFLCLMLVFQLKETLFWREMFVFRNSALAQGSGRDQQMKNVEGWTGLDGIRHRGRWPHQSRGGTRLVRIGRPRDPIRTTDRACDVGVV